MIWTLSDRADPRALGLADRHYNRQKPGTPQFVPPGRCLCLLTADRGAFWVTSWPFAQYTKHRWAGAWVNSAFRRESGPIASELIRDFGRCYRKAGFVEDGETQSGLLALRLYPDAMPEAEAPHTDQESFSWA